MCNRGKFSTFLLLWLESKGTLLSIRRKDGTLLDDDDTPKLNTQIF